MFQTIILMSVNGNAVTRAMQRDKENDEGDKELVAAKVRA